MPEIGQIISHYRILRNIGQVSMDKVSLMEDGKLGRDVAIIVVQVI
jgi:hypothetical protein